MLIFSFISNRENQAFKQQMEKLSEEISITKFIIGHEKDMCPKGTVPIRRTTKEDFIQAKSLKNNHILTQDGRDGYVSFLIYNYISRVLDFLILITIFWSCTSIWRTWRCLLTRTWSKHKKSLLG